MSRPMRKAMTRRLSPRVAFFCVLAFVSLYIMISYFRKPASLQISKQSIEDEELGTKSEPPAVPRLLGSRKGTRHFQGSHNAHFTKGGTLYSWGFNDWRLGRQNAVSRIPQVVLTSKQVTSIAASLHSIFATVEGHVYTTGMIDNDLSWGSSKQPYYGQLGRGGGPAPAQVKDELEKKFVIQVAAGLYHSMALTDAGEVYTWGLNSWGQLGHQTDGAEQCTSGQNCHSWKPGLVEELKGIVIVGIAGGRYSSLAFDNQGAVYAWGYETCTTGFLPSKQEAWRPRRVEGLSEERVVAMAAGHVFWLALDNEGRVYSCNNGDDGADLQGLRKPNSAGELGRSGEPFEVGQVTALEEHVVVAVAAGREHAVVLTQTGEIWSWGGSSDTVAGRSGDRSVPARVFGEMDEDRIYFVAAGEDFSLIASSKVVYAWGKNEFSALGIDTSEQATSEVPLPKRVTGTLGSKTLQMMALAAGCRHGLAVAHAADGSKEETAEEADMALAKAATIEMDDMSSTAHTVTVNLEEDKAFRIAYLDDQATGPTVNASTIWANFKPAPREALKEYIGDVFEGLPKELDPGLRNPCWYEEGRLRCLPYFQLIGTVHGGTADMMNRILKHPDVVAPSNVAPQWWSDCRYPPKGACSAPPRGDFQGYIKLFIDAAHAIRSNPNAITGEASSNYFSAAMGVALRGYQGDHRSWYDVTLPQAMHQAMPWTRYVVILRDPVERYHANFMASRLKSGQVSLKSAEEFHEQVKKDLQEWDECAQFHGVDSCLHVFKPSELAMGIYTLFLADWLIYIPRDQFLVLRFEDYLAAPREHLEAVFKFLGLKPLVEEQWSMMMQIPFDHDNPPPMLKETRDLLSKFYVMLNSVLSERLADPRWTWEDERARSLMWEPDETLPNLLAQEHSSGDHSSMSKMYTHVTYLKVKPPVLSAAAIWSKKSVSALHSKLVDTSPDIYEGLPKQLDPRFTNPCWRMGEGGPKSPLNCLPFFQIIGVNHGGGTDLYNRMAMHPHMYEASMKGSNWWAECPYPPRGPCTAPPRGTFTSYMRLFSKPALAFLNDSAGITGEESPELFTGGLGVFFRGFKGKLAPPPEVTLPDLLRDTMPWTRLILILRNPVERYHSAFYYQRSKKTGVRPPDPEVFHQQVVDDLLEWRKCVSHHPVPDCVHNFKPQNLVEGMYSLFLADWLKTFPSEQLLLLRFEDYVEAPRQHLEAVFKFLGLDAPSEAVWTDMLRMPAKAKSTYPEMRSDTRSMLVGAYRQHNNKLAQILHDARWTWAS